MKNKARLVLSKTEVRAFIIKKNGEKFWFDIPKDTAEKVLRLQKMFREEKQKKIVELAKNQTFYLFWFRLLPKKSGKKSPIL